MIAPRPGLLFAALLLGAPMLGGCATTGPEAGERTVFHNPYAAPVIDRTGIGPQCEIDLGRDATCVGAPQTASGRDQGLSRYQDRRLTRAQRRILRERAELLADRARPAPPAAPPPEPGRPTADAVAPAMP